MTILQKVIDSFSDRLRPYEFRESSKALKTMERSIKGKILKRTSKELSDNFK